jgi:hypothetical protein
MHYSTPPRLNCMTSLISAHRSGACEQLGPVSAGSYACCRVVLSRVVPVAWSIVREASTYVSAMAVWRKATYHA